MCLFRDWPSGSEQQLDMTAMMLPRRATTNVWLKSVTDEAYGIGGHPLCNRASNCVHQNPTIHLNNVNGAAMIMLVNMARDMHTLVYVTRTYLKSKDPTKYKDT